MIAVLLEEAAAIVQHTVVVAAVVYSSINSCGSRILSGKKYNGRSVVAATVVAVLVVVVTTGTVDSSRSPRWSSGYPLMLLRRVGPGEDESHRGEILTICKTKTGSTPERAWRG